MNMQAWNPFQEFETLLERYNKSGARNLGTRMDNDLTFADWAPTVDIEEDADKYLIRADLPDWFGAMKQAAHEVGGVQIQNAGTIIGNICNASPAADGVPGLVALDASVVLGSVSGEREVPITEFVLGNRKTARKPDEMVLGLNIPVCGTDARSTFLKLGARKYLVISIVMVSAVLEKAADGTVSRLRIAVGSCSEVAKRLTALEADLAGKPADSRLAALVTADHIAPLSPIGDVRGSAEYRSDAALTLVRRAIAELTE